MGTNKVVQALRLFVLFIGVTVLAVGGGALVAYGFGGPFVTDRVEGTFAAASTGRISLSGVNGSMTYEPWDGGDIVVEATTRVGGWTEAAARRLGRRVRVELVQEGDRVRADVRRPRWWFTLGRVRVDFVVRVPAEWSGDVRMTTTNGTVSMRGGRGEATLRTANGAITAEDHVGRLEARTSNGRVDVRGIEGRLEARTSNGRVRIVDAALAGNGFVGSSNGAIALEGRFEPGADYEVRTSNGRVTVELVAPDVQLDLRTSNGRIDLQTEVAVSQLERRRLVGRIGVGSARLYVRTSNGAIHVGER